MEKPAAKERKGETMKASEVLKPCPDCNKMPGLWECEFWGYACRKFKVECPICKKKTNYYGVDKSAVNAWNKGHFMEERPSRANLDNEGVTNLMGKVMSTMNDDYQRSAGKEYMTGWDKRRIAELESFVMDNPYRLPYDREYVVEEMRRQAEQKKSKKPRKKQVS